MQVNLCMLTPVYKRSDDFFSFHFFIYIFLTNTLIQQGCIKLIYRFIYIYLYKINAVLFYSSKNTEKTYQDFHKILSSTTIFNTNYKKCFLKQQICTLE